jgi:hypothetical protein
MAIGIGTAIAISAGMSMAGKAVGAKIQSNAANKAAKTLQTSADKQISHANQVYAPYLGMGSGAMTTLGDLMGVTPGNVPQWQGVGAAAPGGAPQGLASLGQPPGPPPSSQQPPPPPGMQPPPPPPPGMQPPPGMSVGDMGMAPPPAAVARTQSGYGQVA